MSENSRSSTELGDAPQGFEYEADLRHAELISEEMGVANSKGVGTPGIKEDEEEGEDDGEAPPLPREE